MEEVENHMEREILRMEVESRSSNEEFARVAVAVFTKHEGYLCFQH